MYNFNRNNETKERSFYRMCTFIKMEYVVANAFCELLTIYPSERKISIDKIKEYGFQVEKVFSEKTNVNAILLFSDEYRKELLRDYTDLFDYEDNYIILKQGKKIEDVQSKILSFASLDLLLALFDESSIAKLGIKK